MRIPRDFYALSGILIILGLATAAIAQPGGGAMGQGKRGRNPGGAATSEVRGGVLWTRQSSGAVEGASPRRSSCSKCAAVSKPHLTVEQPSAEYIDCYRTHGVAQSHLNKYIKLRKDDPKPLYECGYLEEKGGFKKDAVPDCHRAGMIYAEGSARQHAQECVARLDVPHRHSCRYPTSSPPLFRFISNPVNRPKMPPSPTNSTICAKFNETATVVRPLF